MNEKALKLLAKPYFDWTVEEQKRLPELLQTILDSGVHLIILGRERCFFCGVPIDSQATNVKKVTQNIGQNGLVVTNLCQKCYKYYGRSVPK